MVGPPRGVVEPPPERDARGQYRICRTICRVVIGSLVCLIGAVGILAIALPFIYVWVNQPVWFSDLIASIVSSLQCVIFEVSELIGKENTVTVLDIGAVLLTTEVSVLAIAYGAIRDKEKAQVSEKPVAAAPPMVINQHIYQITTNNIIVVNEPPTEESLRKRLGRE